MHVASDAVADDVVADTWLAVIRGIDRFEGRSALRTWIFQILLNIARTRGKREKRSTPFSSIRRSGDDNGEESAVDADRFQADGAWARPPQALPEEAIASAETRDALLSAVAALPERQREVITLRDILGYSAEDARNALELSETNQRVLLHRGRAKVRAALERHFEDAGQ